MELENISIVVRPRSHWESMDMGFHMVRRWWLQLMPPWCLVMTTWGCLIFLTLGNAWPGTTLLLFWLSKPVFDAVPLFVLSRALFGATPTWRQTLAATPRLLWGNLLHALLHRLNLARSFSLPVRQLEGLRGAARRDRSRTLDKRYRGHAVALTLLFGVLEIVVLLALLWVIPLFVPEELDQTFTRFVFETGLERGWIFWVAAAAYVTTVCLVEPFYVAAGFSLYLNRRTILEAWDLELAFRRMNRRAGLLGRAAAAPLLLLAAALWISPDPGTATAADRGNGGGSVPVSPELQPAGTSKAVISEVLAAPEFDIWQEVTTWRFVASPAETEQRPVRDFWLGKWLAEITELLLWVGIAVIALLIAVYHKTWRSWFGWRARQQTEAAESPEAVQGSQIQPAALPADVPGEAERLWQAGDQRSAASLLYRGALAALIQDKTIDIPASATEAECLRRVRRSAAPDLYRHFRALTERWQGVAYAHEPLSREVLDALCADWGRLYGSRA